MTKYKSKKGKSKKNGLIGHPGPITIIVAFVGLGILYVINKKKNPNATFL